MAVASGSRRSQ